MTMINKLQWKISITNNVASSKSQNLFDNEFAVLSKEPSTQKK